MSRAVAATGATARITGVTGGSGGVAATYQALRALADAFDAAGDRLRGWAALGARTAVDPDLVASAPLSPVTFAEAEAAVAAATTGPSGVLVQAGGWEVDAVAVRAVVDAFEATDLLVRAALHQVDQTVARVAGMTITPALPVLLPIATRLPPGTRRELEQWVVEHPGVVQHAAGGGGGLLEGLWDGATPFAPGGPLGTDLLAPDVESGAGLLALLYGRGTGVAGPRSDITIAAGTTQPADLTGLVAHLHEVALLSTGADSPDNGTIEIQTIGAGTDHVRHIVYLPGTDDMTTTPWSQDGDVRDLGTDLHSLAGGPDAYHQGILDAMAQSGIGPHEPVLLVGHSLGGMEAAAILGHGSPYDVTNVVTAGSPTAQVDGFPAGSHVLSLEHRGDVVPLLDGVDNPDSVPQTTVTFDDGPAAGVVEAHGYDHYLAGAAAVDASADPSVAEQLASLHAHGFLADPAGPAPGVTSQVFQIVREP